MNIFPLLKSAQRQHQQHGRSKTPPLLNPLDCASRKSKQLACFLRVYAAPRAPAAQKLRELGGRQVFGSDRLGFQDAGAFLIAHGGADFSVAIHRHCERISVQFYAP